MSDYTVPGSTHSWFWRGVVALLAAMAALSGLGASAGATTLPGGFVGIVAVKGAPGLSPGLGYFTPTIDPGGALATSVMVTNEAAAPVLVKLYPVAGLTAPNTGAVFASGPEAHGSWLSTLFNGRSVKEISMTAKSEAVITLDIKVPATAKAGYYWSGMAARVVGQVSPGTTTTTAVSAVHVHVDSQSVVGVLVDVPGAPVHFSLALGKPSISNAVAGLATIDTPLVATGNGFGAPRQSIWVSGPSHQVVLGHQLMTILPGANLSLPTVLAGSLAPGHYKVRTCLYGGGLAHEICTAGPASIDTTLHGYHYAPAGVRTVVVASTAPVVIYVGAALVACLIVLLIALVLLARRRKEKLA